MESTYRCDDQAKCTLKESWRYCKQMLSAPSFAAGCKSLGRAIEALPLWALIVLAAIATIVVFDSTLLVVPVAAALGLMAVYATVKRAVADALRQERDHQAPDQGDFH